MNLNKKPISVAPTPIVMPPKYATSYTYNITDFDAFSKISFIVFCMMRMGKQLIRDPSK